MNVTKKSYRLLILSGLVILVVVLVYGYYFKELSHNQASNQLITSNTQTATGTPTVVAGVTSTVKNSVVWPPLVLTGVRLNEQGAPILEANREDLERVRNSGRTAVLLFVTSWDPLDTEELSAMQEAFQKMTELPVVGFRVLFNDESASNWERDLARQYGVSYQHTKVILGQPPVIATESWNAELYQKYIRAALVNR